MLLTNTWKAGESNQGEENNSRIVGLKVVGRVTVGLHPLNSYVYKTDKCLVLWYCSCRVATRAPCMHMQALFINNELQQ